MLRVVVVLILLLAACGGGDAGAGGDDGAAPATTTSAAVTVAPVAPPAGVGTIVPGGDCAHVVGAAVNLDGSTATISATVLSADTGWDKYADRWEVRAPDGRVLGERVLTHPHENEQPFTRALSGVEIPAELKEVVLAAHDSVAGFCGDTYTVAIPGR